MSWTEQRVERLKVLYADGLSASQIAADLGGITRNAAIGKAHRLGLVPKGRGRNQHTERVRKPRRTPGRTDAQRVSRAKGLALAFELKQEPEPEIIDSIIPVHQRCTLLELTEDTCRWPIGDPGSADFYFCGGPPITGSPYCGYHTRVAYRPVESRVRLPPPRQL